MMLRTGTSKNGRVYRYYTCSNCATKGKTVCRGRSIPMEKLDRLVTENLMERLFKPERLAAILASLAARRAEKAESLSGRLIALQRQMHRSGREARPALPAGRGWVNRPRRGAQRPADRAEGGP